MSIEGMPFDPTMEDERESGVEAGEVVVSSEKMTDVSARLAELAEADQAEREARPDEEGWERIVAADRLRRAEVVRLWQEQPEGFEAAEDFANAALIFQHGEGVADFDQALLFAKEAVQRGLSPVRSLIPQAFDRRMVARFMEQNQPTEEWRQRYGTQSFNRDSGVFVPEVDGSAEAEELAFYGLGKLRDGETREQARQAAEDRWMTMPEEDRQRVAAYLLGRAS